MRTVGDFHPVVAAEKILASALADAGVAADDHMVTTVLRRGTPRRGADARGPGRRPVGDRFPWLRSDLRRAARLGQPLTSPPGPPAGSSSSDPAPPSGADYPVRKSVR